MDHLQDGNSKAGVHADTATGGNREGRDAAGVRGGGEVMDIPAALASYIATRDKRIAKFWPHNPSFLRDQFQELLSRGVVRVGGRSSCGVSDPTMTALRLWNEVVRKAKSFGFQISESNVGGQRNEWATRGGGFWNESEYRLAGDTDDWPPGVLNRADTLKILREHSAWRRGAPGEQTDPKMLGLALDAAISALSASNVGGAA